MNNPLIMIIPVGALIVAVILIGALWWWWTGERDDSEPVGSSSSPEAKTETPVTEGEFLGALANRTRQALGWLQEKGRSVKLPGAAQGSTSSGGPQTSYTNAEAVEVLRIYRDLADGGLIVEISGRQYRDASQITDQQIQRRFATLVQSLVHFSGAMPAPAATSEQSQAPLFEAPPARQPAQSEETQEEPSADEVNAALSGQMSMAEQIEEVLQEHLMGLSHFSNRSIHIRSNPDGSVRVEVDEQNFDGIGEVSDPEVRELLQTVIREWEKRQ